jgi:hypothetical protein
LFVRFVDFATGRLTTVTKKVGVFYCVFVRLQHRAAPHINTLGMPLAAIVEIEAASTSYSVSGAAILTRAA